MIGIGTMGGGQDASRSHAITKDGKLGHCCKLTFIRLQYTGQDESRSHAISKDGKFLNEETRIRALFEN